MSHANAGLAPAGWLLLVQRVAGGTSQAEVARQMGLSRGTVAKWWGRWADLLAAAQPGSRGRCTRCLEKDTDLYLDNAVPGNLV